MEKEIRELEAKYEKLQQPLLEKQQTIIQGRAVEKEEVEGLEEFLKEEEKEKAEEAMKDTASIPNYWLKSMQNTEILGTEITQKDQDCLKHLQNIKFRSEDNDEKDEGQMHFEFHFSENDFFSNAVLTKSVTYSLSENRPIGSVGCNIEWKQDKNLTKKTIQKKQKNKKSGQQRTVTKEVTDESFFNFFQTIEIDESKFDDMEDEEIDQIQERNEIDFDIASVLHEEVIPYSLEFYLDVHAGEFEDEENLSQIEEGDESDSGDDKKKKKKKKQSGSRKGSKEDGKEQQQ